MKIVRAKCGYSSRYMGLRKPTCGCRACCTRWLSNQEQIAHHNSMN